MNRTTNPSSHHNEKWDRVIALAEEEHRDQRCRAIVDIHTAVFARILCLDIPNGEVVLPKDEEAYALFDQMRQAIRNTTREEK